VTPGDLTELPSFSILLETENLASAGTGALEGCLASLARQDLDPRRANEVLILDSGETPPELIASMRERYPWADVAEVGAQSDYYHAKMRGAELATGELVVLCDSDCWYDPGWLGGLIGSFAGAPDVQLVTGQTTTPVDGPFGVAMALAYLFPRTTDGSGMRTSSHYDTNNSAIRRDFLLAHPFPSDLPMYRGNHVIQARSLMREGHTIWQQPRAVAIHPLPEGASYFFWRFLLLGDEALTIARFSRAAAAGEKPRGRPFHDAVLCLAIGGGRVKQLIARAPSVFSEDRRRLALLPAAAPIALAATALHWAGLALSYLRPGFLLSVYQHRHAD
jgi:glycosyltransferase involved in cell wall biosynthesis